MKVRCEHNCQLCRNELQGKCVGRKHRGKDVSIARDLNTESAENATDIPVCEEYVYGGTLKHLKEIEEAERLGKVYLDI